MGSEAAEHTPHSGGTALGQTAEGISCRSFAQALPCVSILLIM